MRGAAHMRAVVHIPAQRSPTHGTQAGCAGSRSPLRARRAGVRRGARGTHPVGDDDTQDRDLHGGRRKRHPEDGRHADAPAHPLVCQPPAKHTPRHAVSPDSTKHARCTQGIPLRARSGLRLGRVRRLHRPVRGGPVHFSSRHEESWGSFVDLRGSPMSRGEKDRGRGSKGGRNESHA